MNNERMIAVSSGLIERAISLLDLLPESGTIIELRAALATQPTSGGPVDGVEGFACWLIDHCEGYEIFEEKIQEWVAGYLKSEAYQRVAAAHGDDVDQFLEQVKAELRRARAKFPGDRIMTLALAEEFGELCKAVLDESAEAVRKEAVQVACMAARVVLDGDGSVVDWRRERGLDPLLADAAMRAQGDGEVQ